MTTHIQKIQSKRAFVGRSRARLATLQPRTERKSLWLGQVWMPSAHLWTSQSLGQTWQIYDTNGTIGIGEFVTEDFVVNTFFFLFFELVLCYFLEVVGLDEFHPNELVPEFRTC